MFINTRSQNGRGGNFRGRAAAAQRSEKDRAGNQAAQSFDSSPESAQLRAMQLMADNSPQSAKFASLQAMADRSPDAVAQRKLMEGSSGALIQRQGDEEDLQMKADPSLIQRAGDEEELMMKADPSPIQRQGDEEDLQMKAAPAQRVENKTGMPDNVKSGVENLSGLSMDDVKVHYNSPKPASVQALAYTQGTDIHVAPGQEKHVAHEAWHVAQQMQGRVKPTVEIAGTAVNDNAGLEHEADVMGAKAKNHP